MGDGTPRLFQDAKAHMLKFLAENGVDTAGPQDGGGCVF